MNGYDWLKRLGAALLCVSCSSGGGAGLQAGAGASAGAGAGAGGGVGHGGASGAAAGADSGPKAGDSCACIEQSHGYLECVPGEACECVCPRVDCVTEGGLSATISCRNAVCEACEAPPASAGRSTFTLQMPVHAEIMAPDQTTYVAFGLPDLGHYETSGFVITMSAYLDRSVWGNAQDWLIAGDGTLYVAATTAGFVTTKKTIIEHATADGEKLQETLGPDDVSSIRRLTRGANGTIYALGAMADGGMFVAPLDEAGTLGERTKVVGFVGDVSSFAADKDGNFVFAGGSSGLAPYSSRIALLPAGASELTDLFDASHALIEQVMVDPKGGWWFSSGTVQAQNWLATLYHVDAKGELSKEGELVSALGKVEPFTPLSTGFALLSDSVLLMNVNPTTDQKQSVGRFADGKLIQAVNAENAYLISAAGKQWATILTNYPGYSNGPGILQIEFEKRHFPN